MVLSVAGVKINRKYCESVNNSSKKWIYSESVLKNGDTVKLSIAVVKTGNSEYGNSSTESIQ